MYATLRLLSAALILFSFTSSANGAVIWTNPITGTNPSNNNPYTSGQTVISNLSVSGIGYSGGVSSNTANDRYNTKGWNSGSFDANRYISFTLTPATGYVVNFTSFVYTGQASGTGPTSCSIRCSVDGYASDIGSPSITGTTISLSGSTYQSLSGSITFRFYAWGASSATGTFSINDFTFNGTITRPTTFYHNSGALHTTTNWGHKTDGTGAVPLDFTTASQTFNLRNASTSSTANWTVSGTSSKIVVPSGVTFTIAASNTVSGTIDVNNGGTVNVAWNCFPTFGTLGSSSAINFTYSGAQTIPSGTFANMTVSGGGTKSLQGALTINGTLTFSSGSISLGSNNLVIGSSGSISGASSSNYIIAEGTGTLTQQVSAGSGKTFPVGTTVAYTPVTINLTGGSTTDNFSVRLSYFMRGSGSTGTILTQDAVSATWFITEGTAGNSDVTLTMQWPAGIEMSGFNRSACRVGHYTGGSWDYGSSDIVASGSDPYTASRSGITSFSPFGIGEDGALPVTWLDIHGENTGRYNTVHWSTASEWNNDFFEIQSSTDGINFNTAGTMKGSGNSSEIKSYQFTDETDAQAITYYRIRQVDYDGNYTFSKMIAVYRTNSNSAFTCIPNPASDIITIGNTKEGASLEVIDLQGKTVKTIPGMQYQTCIDISGLSDGLYLIKNTWSGSTVRLVKSSK